MRRGLLLPLAVLALGLAAAAGFFAAAVVLGEGDGGGQSAEIQAAHQSPGDDESRNGDEATPTPEAERAYAGLVLVEAPDDHGLRITEVIAGSPAEEAGLEVGDVITAVDGLPVFALERIVPWPPFIPDLLGDKDPGDEVTFTVQRDDQELEVTVTLGAAPASVRERLRSRLNLVSPFRDMVRPYLGVSLADVTVEIREELDLPMGGGVAVLEVAKGGPADEAGLRRGDVILMIGFKRVETVEGVVEAILEHDPGEDVPLFIRRGFEEMQVPVVLGERPGLDSLGELVPGESLLPQGLSSLLSDAGLDLDLDWDSTDLADLFEQLVGVDVVLIGQSRTHVAFHVTAGVVLDVGETELRIAPNGYSGIDRHFTVTEETRVFVTVPGRDLTDLWPGDGVLVVTRDDSDEALAILSPLFAWGRHRGVLPPPLTPEILLTTPDVQ